jgi:3',5'-cyclic AMP phosphodiesterase CpdA
MLCAMKNAITSLLQISDTHFGTEQPAVVAALEAHVREHGADLLVLSGDITQRARGGQFAAAKAFVERLKSYGIPSSLVIPGNHDLPLFNVLSRFLAPYDRYQAHFGKDLEPSFENDQLLVIGLNTTHPKRHKDGLVTHEQVEAVTQRLLKSDPRKLRLVVAHQPFGSLVLSDLENLQHGALAALSRWADAGLDIVMGGHIHLPYVLPLRKQYPSLSREIWIVQAGTALSSRVRGSAPNSFNRLDLDSRAGKQVAVERWDYQGDEAYGQFVLGERLALDWNTPR